MLAYKAFRIDNKGQLRFLFHTYKGSSLVPLNQWIETKRPWVKEGKKRYRAGFHFFPKIEDCKRFDKLTKGKYIIIPVEVEDIEPKPRSSVGSWLAKKLLVNWRKMKIKRIARVGTFPSEPIKGKIKLGNLLDRTLVYIKILLFHFTFHSFLL
jgi:hypothetical protein